MEIQATITKIIYPNTKTDPTDNPFHVLVTDLGKAVGDVFFDTCVGQILTLTGEWKKNPSFGGRDFKFTGARIFVPTDPKAILHLAVARTKGMGEATELKIWDAFGATWRDESELTGIPGVSEAVLFHFKQAKSALAFEKVQTEAIAYLLAHGCTDNLAAKAWKQWKDLAISKVAANPFILADLPSYGFAAIDRLVRPSFNIADDDPRRVQACAFFILRQQTGESNNTVIPRANIIGGVLATCGVSISEIENAIDVLIDAKRFALLNEKTKAPMLALGIDYRNERIISRWIMK